MRGFRLLLIPVALGLVLVAGVLWALRSSARSPLTRVEIQVGYPQRAARVEADIAVPLEDALQGMPHLARTESVSSHGQALLAASFSAKAPRAKLAEEVWTRLKPALERLPRDATPSSIEVRRDEEIELRFVVSSEKTPALDLRRELDALLLQLRKIRGVREVRACGAAPELHVVVDAARAEAMGVAASDLVTLSQPGALVTTEGLQDLALADGKVRLRDIARFERVAALGGCRAFQAEKEVLEGIAVVEEGRAEWEVERELKANVLPQGTKLEIFGEAISVHVRTSAESPRWPAPGMQGALAQVPEIEAAVFEQASAGPGDHALAVRLSPGGKPAAALHALAGALERSPGLVYAGAEERCPGQRTTRLALLDYDLRFRGPCLNVRTMRLWVSGHDVEALERVAVEVRRRLQTQTRSRLLPPRLSPELVELEGPAGERRADLERVMAVAREGVVLRSMSDGAGKIPVRAFWGRQEDVPDLAKLPVRGADGQVVPAGSLARVSVAVDRPIARVDRERVVEIRVEIDPDDVAAFMREATANLRQVQLPVGMTLHWQGDEG